MFDALKQTVAKNSTNLMMSKTGDVSPWGTFFLHVWYLYLLSHSCRQKPQYSARHASMKPVMVIVNSWHWYFLHNAYIVDDFGKLL